MDVLVWYSEFFKSGVYQGVFFLWFSAEANASFFSGFCFEKVGFDMINYHYFYSEKDFAY
jgi:hypothetical protein